ncbi:MAG: redox-sensitive transcriptional activator SoxR, partial [Pseudoalteromonas nigrifaciens]
YSRDVLRRIAIIKVSQNVGIPLIEIKQALSVLPKFAATTQKDWQVLSSNWHATLDAKIKKLVLLRDQLENCIGCGCLSVKECPIRNPGDILGKQGSGAVLLRTKP